MNADYHLHTSFSDDSEYDMEELIKKAINMNLDEICFTEHIDYGVDGDHVIDYDAYFDRIHQLRDKYKSKITIKQGIEFGIQKHTIPRYENDLSKYDFDFVILSNHQVNDQQFWNGEYQENKTQKEINVGYYEAILDVIENFTGYSVLGHLDMVKRYDNFGIYPDELVKDLLISILKRVIQDGKGIEINTSCYRYGLPDLTPSTYILKLYHELGGNIITLGSDTHSEEHLSFKIAEVREVLKNIGFRQFCTYNKMIPTFHDL
ncbi:MAG: histidinol phosphate phosphatase [Anaerocolumna sp.]|jgi:histidinol-phosphatase (PHP family)|nr:histidinol phosphate phosphatase [Anaerocolumna sp.]